MVNTNRITSQETVVQPNLEINKDQLEYTSERLHQAIIEGESSPNRLGENSINKNR